MESLLEHFGNLDKEKAHTDASTHAKPAMPLTDEQVRTRKLPFTPSSWLVLVLS